MVDAVFNSYYGTISYSDVDDRPSLVESFRTLYRLHGKGWSNANRIQRDAVSFIGMRCGDDIKRYLDNTDKSYCFNDILEEARQTYTPMVRGT